MAATRRRQTGSEAIAPADYRMGIIKLRNDSGRRRRLSATCCVEWVLGVSREHVNRTLIMWERSGLILQSKGGEIVIENRKRLEQIVRARRAA